MERREDNVDVWVRTAGFVNAGDGGCGEDADGDVLDYCCFAVWNWVNGDVVIGRVVVAGVRGSVEGPIGG